MKENKLIIAAAGSGKTTYLVKEAYNRKENVLITTFTNENEAEIREKFISLYGCVPNHITIKPWFSFLLEHGVRPYQGTCYEELFDLRITGVYLVNELSGVKCRRRIGGKSVPIFFSEDTEFIKHYFTDSMKLYTDKIAKFVVRANDMTNGEIIDRISRIYPVIFIDEVQDLAGNDLDIMKALYHSNSTVICVGDPRQVTYHTHTERKHKKYDEGLVKEFVLEECYKKDHIVIEENSLSNSHRNNQQICDFSSAIYPTFPKSQPCNCKNCHPQSVEHQGIFLVRASDVYLYMKAYSPIQLRISRIVETLSDYSALNFGQSKGKTFDRVIIYPTDDIKKWLINHSKDLKNKTRAGFYVAVTRAKYSVAFVIPDKECSKIKDIVLWDSKNN